MKVVKTTQVCIICSGDSSSSFIVNHNRGRILECFSNSVRKGKDFEEDDIAFCECCTTQLISLLTLKSQVKTLEGELSEKAYKADGKFEQKGLEENPVYREIRAKILEGIGIGDNVVNRSKAPKTLSQVPRSVGRIGKRLKKKCNEKVSYPPATSKEECNGKQKKALEFEKKTQFSSSSSPPLLHGVFEADEVNVETSEQQPPPLTPQSESIKQTRNYKASLNKITIFQVDLERVGDGSSFSCSKCPTILRNDRRVMRRHVIRFHSKLYSCSFPFCGKSFSTKHCLERHVESTHNSKDKGCPSPFHPCPVCERPFSDLRNMKRHKWAHFSEEDKNEVIEKGEKIPEWFKGEKKFQCEICSHVFGSRWLLELHKNRKHVSKEEREKEKGLCPLCGTPVLDVRDHVRRTHGEKAVNKMYECGSCGKRFSSSGALTRHKKIHV